MLIAAMCASAHADEFMQTLPDPARVYLDYREAIRRRDVAAVFDALTECAGRSLRECEKFRALFETWCASQDELAAVVASMVMNDDAIVTLRSPTALIHAKLIWNGIRWLVASDEYTALRSGKRL